MRPFSSFAYDPAEQAFGVVGIGPGGMAIMPNHVERIEDAFAFAGTTFVR